ncbi:hypothetical protein MMC26_002185 [Xylographa opegraphella]|nr:hypothetical protein [Xylographa opegraphella]
MSMECRSSTPEEVVGKVLRRAEVSKITRKLQDRLALAKYKAQHGLHSMSFDLVEAHVDNQLKRRRTDSSVISSSSGSSSSSSSEHQLFSAPMASSPMTAPVFSDDLYGSETLVASRKRTRFQTPYMGPTTTSRKSKRTQSMAPPPFESTRHSWKTTHNLPVSSPLQHRLHPDFRTSNGPNISFLSQASTIPNSPPFGPVSDDDDLPTHSFRLSSSNMHGSPPRTPPPTRSRGLRARKNNATGEEGADLLLYLATSPSPANPATKARVFAPSTPPSNQVAFPNSFMATPGGTNLFTGFSTPGQQFNFADFVNVTPSPAQGAFGNRTPGLMKTPLAVKDARRRLNFDSLIPPGGSPSIGRGSTSTSTGLGMELGGELVS